MPLPALLVTALAAGSGAAAGGTLRAGAGTALSLACAEQPAASVGAFGGGMEWAVSAGKQAAPRPQPRFTEFLMSA